MALRASRICSLLGSFGGRDGQVGRPIRAVDRWLKLPLAETKTGRFDEPDEESTESTRLSVSAAGSRSRVWLIDCPTDGRHRLVASAGAADGR